MKIPPAVIDVLKRALPAQFTGTIRITFNIHRGTVGKIVLSVDEVIN